MKKIFFILSLFFCLPSYIFCEELCQEFDSQANVITVNCQTGQRVITQDDIDRENKIKEELLLKQTKLEQKNKAKELRKEQAEQKRQQKLLQKQEEQTSGNIYSGKQVEIDGKTYFLYDSPYVQKSEKSGIKTGDWLISLSGGAGTFGRNIKTNYLTVKQKDVPVFGGGISVIKFLSPYIGIGIGIETETIRKKQTYAYVSPVYTDISSQGNLYNALITGRVNLNPLNNIRAYIPFGAGYSMMKEERQTYSYYYSYPYSYSYYDNKSISSSSFIYNIGLGLEFDLTKYVSLGIEGKYNKSYDSKDSFFYYNGLAKINIKLPSIKKEKNLYKEEKEEPEKTYSDYNIINKQDNNSDKDYFINQITNK